MRIGEITIGMAKKRDTEKLLQNDKTSTLQFKKTRKHKTLKETDENVTIMKKDTAYKAGGF